MILIINSQGIDEIEHFKDGSDITGTAGRLPACLRNHPNI